jgi:hypothetical protein
VRHSLVLITSAVLTAVYVLTPLSTPLATTATTAVAVAQDIDALVAQTAGHEGTMDPEVRTSTVAQRSL